MNGHIFGFASSDYFIDIGIPEDYTRAHNMNLEINFQKTHEPKKDREGWSLFLDRDGVINTHISDDYVISLEQFSFIPGVLDAYQAHIWLF